MAFERPSRIIGHPADELTEALDSVASDDLQIVAEYDAQSYELLYVSDAAVERHGGLGAVEEKANTFFEYYHIDFLEREMLQDMLRLGEIETFVTFLDHGIIIRAHMASAAVFILLDITASVDDVQITLQNTLFAVE